MKRLASIVAVAALIVTVNAFAAEVNGSTGAGSATIDKM